MGQARKTRAVSPAMKTTPPEDEADGPALAAGIARERTELSGRRDTLSAAKRELLEKRLRGLARGGAAAAAPGTAALPSSLVRLHAGSAGRPPFFCVHAIGGTVFSYAELARRLGPEQTFYGIQSAGLEGARPADDLETMAAAYAAAVELAEAREPYLLGGWSFGGVVAFEMARRLRARGRAVALVALLDSWAPLAHGATGAGEPAGSGAERGEAETLLLFLRDQAALQGRSAEWLAAAGAQVAANRETTVGEILARARRSGVLQANVKPEQVERMLAIHRANLRALAGYRPQPAADRLTLFRPEAAAGESRLHPQNGWESLTSAPVEVHAVAGDHYTLLAPPHVEALARHLAAAVERALRA